VSTEGHWFFTMASTGVEGAYCKHSLQCLREGEGTVQSRKQAIGELYALGDLEATQGQVDGDI
jgi:hypothetical protein